MNGNDAIPTTAEDDPVVADLRRRIETLEQEQEQLREQLEPIAERINRYRKAIKALTGEPLGHPKASMAPKRTKASRMRPERLAKIEQGVREFAKDHEEFRQVDIRGSIGISSGDAANAFELLRQQNVIRFARREGINKWYRLTNEALNVS